MSVISLTRAELARLIDHTILKPEATQVQIDQLCDECLEYGFFAACVNPVWVSHCLGRLVGSETIVATVAGFPLGAATPEVKSFETLMAIENGASEIDMVANIGALAAGARDVALRDIRCVVETVKGAEPGTLVKVILETRALTNDQIILGCLCAAEAGADFVKTSTGFHPAGGATVAHVALLRQHARGLRVKASGGIRDLPTALELIDAGANRLGMSASVAVLRALES